MNQRSDLIFPSTLATQALATMGVDPAWDAKVAEYLACSTMARANIEWGPHARREDDRKRRQFELKAKFGKGYAKHPDAQREVVALYKAGVADEDVMSERYYVPWWRAGRELAATPAPTIAAAALKALLIEMDELWNDSEMRGDCFDILEADFARLLTNGGGDHGRN